MRRLLSMLLILAATAAPLAAHGADWPRFRGPKGDAVSAETGLNKDWNARPPKELWRVALTDNGYAGIAVAEGRVFVIDHAGKQNIVRALALENGRELWRYAYDDTSTNQHGFARSTPTVDGGLVYTVSRQGKLHCLEASSGRKVWAVDFEKDLGGAEPMFGHAASPVVLGDWLIVLPGGAAGNIAALDKATGKPAWRGGNAEKPAYCTPRVVMLNGRRQILYGAEKNLVAVDPQDGRLLWTFPWETLNGDNVCDPLVLGDTVFITSGYKWGCALIEFKDGQPRARYAGKQMESQMSTPMPHGGRLYGTTDPAALVCLEPATGRVLWSEKGFQCGQIVLVDGVLLVLDGKTGELAMVAPDPAGYRELGRFRPLGGQSWTPLALAGGKMFIHNKKTLACFELK